jgi:hypothetical protein
MIWLAPRRHPRPRQRNLNTTSSCWLCDQSRISLILSRPQHSRRPIKVSSGARQCADDRPPRQSRPRPGKGSNWDRLESTAHGLFDGKHNTNSRAKGFSIFASFAAFSRAALRSWSIWERRVFGAFCAMILWFESLGRSMSSADRISS